MNPLHTEFKRKFAISMYKNMGIPMGEMNFLKDFVSDTRGDLYPLLEKSDDCAERVCENRYFVSAGSAERFFCQLFPFATRSELFDHVGSCVESLYLPKGGLGLSVEFDHGTPLENMAAVLDAVEVYRHYKG